MKKLQDHRLDSSCLTFFLSRWLLVIVFRQSLSHLLFCFSILPPLNFLFTGGWDPETAAFAQPIDVPGQVEQAFRNVETALRAAGGTGWDQVYKVRSYHVPLTDEAVGLMVANLRKFCGENNTPLWTVLGVERLGMEDMKVEIEVSAYTGAKQT